MLATEIDQNIHPRHRLQPLSVPETWSKPLQQRTWKEPFTRIYCLYIIARYCC